MRLNPDIWGEIITHLERPWNKRALHALSLTCRSISELALEALWNSGEPSRAIVSVINSFAPSPDKPFLEQVEGYEGDADVNDDTEDPAAAPGTRINSWVLNEQIPATACECALGYLARIKRLLVFHTGSLDDGLLWPILSASLNVRGPILPNLRTLNVTFHTWDRNEYLIPLLSPSIKILVIECELYPKLDVIFTFLNLAKVRRCDLEYFTYVGPPGNSISEAIMLFNNLEEVDLLTDTHFYPTRSLTIVGFLKSLPALRFLSCHVESFSSCAEEERFCHRNLREIAFGFDPAAEIHEMFQICVFPSVTNVTLRTYGLLDLDVIRSSCPDTHKLKLDFGLSDLREPLDFNHLVPLLPLSLQSFTLLVPEHTLTISNLRSFAEAWPNIHFLKIASDTLFDPLPSLTTFSNYPCLETLNIPLSLAGLFEDISKEHGGAIPHGGITSPLRALCFNRWGSGRLSRARKRVVAEHMLQLFPGLAEVLFVEGYRYDSGLRRFQNIFLELGTKVEVSLDL